MGFSKFVIGVLLLEKGKLVLMKIASLLVMISSVLLEFLNRTSFYWIGNFGIGEEVRIWVLIMSLQAIVDENKQVIFDDNGNIFVYNSLNNCATYMEDTAENRNLLNMPLQNDEMIGQGSNANCSADKTKDDGPMWTHDKILLLFSLYQDNINLFKSAKKTNRSIWNGIAECMAKKGYMFTGDIKFRNLKKTYKRIIDNNKGTGNGAISWPYFDLFDSLFGKSADTVPIATASNTDGYLSRCSTPGTPDTSVDSGELIEKPSTSDRSIRKRRRLPPDEEPHWAVTYVCGFLVKKMKNVECINCYNNLIVSKPESHHFFTRFKEYDNVKLRLKYVSRNVALYIAYIHDVVNVFIQLYGSISNIFEKIQTASSK
ncbi:hypothetical protein FQA39_LY12664 [Lamprigera yunnana]|nr:hypothetical protein FQA39_LY12664 [Lamprigera yunnana]